MPRNGEYELFTYKGTIVCMDDPDIPRIEFSEEIAEWIREQDHLMWRSLSPPNQDIFYLKPKLYMMWKLKWV